MASTRIFGDRFVVFLERHGTDHDPLRLWALPS